MHINFTWNCRVCVGVVFLCLLCAFLPSLTTYEWTDQQHIAKSKMGYISLSSVSNAIIGIASYYCVILKIVILHVGIKTIQNGVFSCLWKKNKILFLFKKRKKTVFFKRTQKTGGLFVLKKNRFFSTLVRLAASYNKHMFASSELEQYGCFVSVSIKIIQISACCWVLAQVCTAPMLSKSEKILLSLNNKQKSLCQITITALYPKETNSK